MTERQNKKPPIIDISEQQIEKYLRDREEYLRLLGMRGKGQRQTGKYEPWGGLRSCIRGAKLMKEAGKKHKKAN